METIKEQTIRTMERLELDALNSNVLVLVSNGCNNQEIEELLQKGMQLVGDRFASGEYFLADLIVSGMMFKSALSLLMNNTSVPPASPKTNCGRVLIGECTVILTTN